MGYFVTPHVPSAKLKVPNGIKLECHIPQAHIILHFKKIQVREGEPPEVRRGDPPPEVREWDSA